VVGGDRTQALSEIDRFLLMHAAHPATVHVRQLRARLGKP
jgi:hypothetical protein